MDALGVTVEEALKIGELDRNLASPSRALPGSCRCASLIAWVLQVRIEELIAQLEDSERSIAQAEHIKYYHIRKVRYIPSRS